MNTNIFRNLSYGVYVISTLDGKRLTGCTVNSIMQITSSPATIAVSMNHDNYTNSCMQKNKKFAINILAETSDSSIIGTFGFQSGKDINKFESVSYFMEQDLPIIEDSCGYIVCQIIDTMETTTHTVFLAEVLDGDVLKKDPAMTYAYYHMVIKGKSPKNAPTYLPEEKEDSERWVCSVCGYVYDGDIPFEELGEDYKCPVCKQPKKAFSKKNV